MSRLYKWGEMKMNVGVMSSNFDFGNHVGISCLPLLRALTVDVFCFSYDLCY